jgi:hypothetical protein
LFCAECVVVRLKLFYEHWLIYSQQPCVPSVRIHT